MFTGLVEETGRIAGVLRSAKSAALRIQAQQVLEGIKLGDSIAVNGVCLTVTSFDGWGFTADVMAETMARTNLSQVKAGAPVNLERALRVGDRLGGHFVSGHIDGMGRIQALEKEDIALRMTICPDPSLLKYVIPKGSVAIDGVSLTVVRVDGQGFQVGLIPHTGQHTTLLQKREGEWVNLECDLIGKYVEKLLIGQVGQTAEPPGKGLDMTFLREKGFA